MKTAKESTLTTEDNMENLIESFEAQKKKDLEVLEEKRCLVCYRQACTCKPGGNGYEYEMIRTACF